MITSYVVGSLTFNLDSTWRVERYDDWAFYRNQLSTMREGVKAADLLVIDSTTGHPAILYIIEVKDYRLYKRTKIIDIIQEISMKVLDTLAGLLPAKINASNSNEKAFARQSLRVTAIRIVFHLEQPQVSSKLFPRAFDIADLTQRLRKRVKAVDPHPFVVDTTHMSTLPWSVI